MKNKTILLGLNELNFDYINFYIRSGLLPNFKKLFKLQSPIETTSENEYKLLEPWIQWVTINTGKSYKEHKVLRLGDIVERGDLKQIYEELEEEGLSVGLVSPFNTENRLKRPAYFIPDPWTKTDPSGNWLVKSIYKAIHQAVNDNAQQKFNIETIISLLGGFVFCTPINRWPHYLKTAFNFSKPGSKAIILDSLLSDIHFTLWKKHKPDFSYLFLNSGAHIQHHYLFNSKPYQGVFKNPNWHCQDDFDPLINILNEYDVTIGKLLKLRDTKIIVATGLHQEAHPKLTHHWRIKEFEKFSKAIGLKNYLEIVPRMSIDFLIKFSNSYDTKKAEDLLNSFYMKSDNLKIFNVDNRSDSLFVELVYPNYLNEQDSIYSNDTKIEISNFKSYVSFVSIKNGQHNGIGYLTANFNLKLKKQIKLTMLSSIIKNVALNKK